MKVTVLGLWHLGCVTAACTARDFAVVGLDFDASTVARLNGGHAPISEPGLDDLIKEGLAAGRLRFTADAGEACSQADILWVAFDTPVDDDDRADVDSVLAQVRRCVPLLPKGALILVSSQLPVGSCRILENEFGPAATVLPARRKTCGSGRRSGYSAMRTGSSPDTGTTGPRPS